MLTLGTSNWEEIRLGMNSGWWEFSLIGSGHIDKGAIYSIKGDSVWATSAGFTVCANTSTYLQPSREINILQIAPVGWGKGLWITWGWYGYRFLQQRSRRLLLGWAASSISCIPRDYMLLERNTFLTRPRIEVFMPERLGLSQRYPTLPTGCTLGVLKG